MPISICYLRTAPGHSRVSTIAEMMCSVRCPSNGPGRAPFLHPELSYMSLLHWFETSGLLPTARESSLLPCSILWIWFVRSPLPPCVPFLRQCASARGAPSVPAAFASACASVSVQSRPRAPSRRAFPASSTFGSAGVNALAGLLFPLVRLICFPLAYVLTQLHLFLFCFFSERRC